MGLSELKFGFGSSYDITATIISKALRNSPVNRYGFYIRTRRVGCPIRVKTVVVTVIVVPEFP